MRRINPERRQTRAESKERMRANRIMKGIPLVTDLERSRAKIRMLEWRAKQIESGLCLGCKAPATHGLRCETHWLIMYALSHRMTPSKTYAEMLRQLWNEQGGRCALTGLAMDVGGGGNPRNPMVASVDHKIPKVNGGTNSKENLQWVCLAANAAKADMPQAEFVELCRKVTAHADARVVPIRKV